MWSIIIDDRENKVIPFFNCDIPFVYKVKRINVGDYVIMYKNQIIMVIERKTWKDLASSIKDGRKKNVEKMIKIRDDTKCILMYLIEGNPLPPRTKKFSRIPYKNLRSHLDHLMFRDNIHIVHSKNEKDSVKKICELVENYSTTNLWKQIDENKEENKEENKGENKEEKKGGESLLHIKKEITDKDILYNMWCCIPCITDANVHLFINKYHISDILLGRIPESVIKCMQYPSGVMIGTKRAHKITSIKKLEKKYITKMIASINGISKSTADIIFDKIQFKEFLNGNINKETIACIQKTAKKKIGLKLSEKLINLFVKQN